MMIANDGECRAAAKPDEPQEMTMENDVRVALELLRIPIPRLDDEPLLETLKSNNTVLANVVRKVVDAAGVGPEYASFGSVPQEIA